MESAREAWQERDGEACLQLVQQITGSEAPNTQVEPEAVFVYDI